MNTGYDMKFVDAGHIPSPNLAALFLVPLDPNEAYDGRVTSFRIGWSHRVCRLRFTCRQFRDEVMGKDPEFSLIY